MKKTLLILAILFCFLDKPYAAHIKGGFFTYQYLGPGTNPNTLRYRITLTVYMQCVLNPGQLSNPINFTIFNVGNSLPFQSVSVPITNQYTLNKAFDEPCISDDQRKCYYTIVVYDLASIELPVSAAGYIISYQRCCRIDGIQNVIGSGSIGNTFTIRIPGTATGMAAETNSSPMFPINDTVVVCSGSYFQYAFTATDIDTEDSLSYSFCEAFSGGGPGNGTGPGGSTPDPASSPPYNSIPYNFPYSGGQPMGSGITINPVTGVISGVAPGAPGQYVICVCVNEYRQGVLINTTRKELHVEVGNCAPIAVNLAPQYITCDGYSWTFSNGGDQSLITSYNWTFGDPGSGAADSSNLASPTHIFSDTGTFTVTLIVNRGDPCSDTNTTIMKVYPGFFPDFTNVGICLINPVQFVDATATNYGVVDSWSWNFGDPSTLADTSHQQNPSWMYSATGPKTITLTATNSKGCSDTVSHVVDIIDKPPITLAFRDTLICRPDVVQLQASGTGNFSWTPLVNIVNPNTATPTVNPIVTTWYHVQLNEQGCINNDSVLVRVVNFVTLDEMNDTTICATDPVQLTISSDGLQYSWIPAGGVNNPSIQNPIGVTGTTTTYQVTATIGSCTATKAINVIAVPYPVVDAGNDTTICYNEPAFLQGTHDGISFTWSPTSSLINFNTLTPTAFPPRTTEYVLSALGNQGCPKPGFDTVLVTVLPKIIPFAGRDTAVIVGQPLQFNAEGGVSYQWIPPTSLSNAFIKNPIGIYSADMDSIRYTVLVFNEVGCVDSASIGVKIFKTSPSVFVPTGFTPNNDGLNDVVRPIAVGIKQIKYFSIYNRWGQLLFKTSINGHGWDGRIAGVPQGTNVFVWMVSAVDYLDRPYFQKGTVTLIR